MTNRIAIALAATLALWSGAGLATLKNIENAYESDAAHVSLPSNTSGQVVIRPCTSCKAVVLRVNPQTVYLAGRPAAPVSLETLRQAANAKGADKRLLIVFYNMESMLVTRVVLGGGA